MSTKLLNKSIQRIYKDLKELELSPLQGISLTLPDESDPFTLRANIYILEGIYKSILLHLIIFIPKNYPMGAPNMIIAPGQPFDGRFHHHVFGDIEKGFKICIDLLDSGYFKEDEKTGWTPAYTLSTALMQMQIFFGQHDLHVVPPTALLLDLKAQLRRFETEIKLTDGTYIKHSFLKPYPGIDLNLLSSDSKLENEVVCEDFSEKIKEKVKEKLKCCITKNSIEESGYFVGYPIEVTEIKGMVYYKIIPEIISYDAYLMQKEFNKKEILRTAMGDYYTDFFPIYLQEASFSQNKTIISSLYKKLTKLDANKRLIPQLISILSSSFFLYKRKKLHLSQKLIESMTHIIRIMVRFLEEEPEESIESLKKQETSLTMYCHTHESFEAIIYHILIKNLIGLKSDILENLIMELFSEQFSNKFQLFSKENKITIDDFYLLFNDIYSAIIFAQLFSSKFLKDLQKFLKEIDQNYGVLSEKTSELFILELIQTVNKIQSFPQFLHYIGLEIVDINSFFRTIYLKWFLEYDSIAIFNSFFLDDLQWLIEIILGFLENDVKNIELLEIFKKDITLVYKFQRILKDPDMGLPEKISRVPKELIAVNGNILYYVKLLGSTQFHYFLMCLQSDSDYKANSFYSLKQFNIREEIRYKDKKNEEMLFLTFDPLIRGEISKIIDNLKKKPMILLAKLCFIICLYEKNRAVIPSLKVFYDKYEEERKFKIFLSDNINRNFKECKVKMNSIIKQELRLYALNDMEVMLFLISDDFKLMKNSDIIQFSMEYLLLKYLHENLKEIQKDLQANNFILSKEKNDEIYDFLLKKQAEMTSGLDYILKALYGIENPLENFIIKELPKMVNFQIDIEEFNVNRLINLIQEHKKSFFFAKNVFILEDFLKKTFPYHLTYCLFQDLIKQPIILLNRYVNNPNKNDKYLYSLLNDIYQNLLVAQRLLLKEKGLLEEMIEFILIYDENEESESERRNIEEVLNFLIILQITGKFQLYQDFFKEKLFKKYIRTQISYLWNIDIEGKDYGIEGIASFFTVRHIIEEFAKKNEDFNVQNFEFYVLWSFNKMKIKEDIYNMDKNEFLERWTKEIKGNMKENEFDLNSLKKIMGLEEELKVEGVIEGVVLQIKDKFII